MLQSDDQTSQSRVNGEKEVETIAAGGPTPAPKMQRPVGVMVISAFNFILGLVLLFVTLPPIFRLITYRRDLDRSNMEDLITIEGWVSAGAMPFAALFFLAAVGLWMLRKWGIILAFITGILVLLTGYLLNPLSVWFPINLLLGLVGPASLLLVAKREVRVQFR
ncbi:MAG TPA: hypothetical protein VEX13_01880 [Chloroflexia bacterium]|nr:hypothetical protein [Chloroflexia bacterium]